MKGKERIVFVQSKGIDPSQGHLGPNLTDCPRLLSKATLKKEINSQRILLGSPDPSNWTSLVGIECWSPDFATNPTFDAKEESNSTPKFLINCFVDDFTREGIWCPGPLWNIITLRKIPKTTEVSGITMNGRAFGFAIVFVSLSLFDLRLRKMIVEVKEEE